MSRNNPPRTGSPYNPQNTPDTHDRPVAAPDPSIDAPLADRVTARAVEKFDLDEDFLQFPPILVPYETADDDLYIEDVNGLVRYNLRTAQVTKTEKLQEMIEVVNHNQHAATNLRQMILG